VKIRPLQDRVLVQRVEEEEKTAGGIIIPDTAKEKPQEAVVVAAGPGKIQDDGNLIPMDVKVKDRVLFGKYAGTDITLDGEDYVILREEDILAVFESKKKGK
jgi:chaperonin GroES